MCIVLLHCNSTGSALPYLPGMAILSPSDILGRNLQPLYLCKASSNRAFPSDECLLWILCSGDKGIVADDIVPLT